MLHNELNAFQKQCLEKCKNFLKTTTNADVIEFEKKVGKKEIYHMAVVKVAGQIFELYIYEDEAGFMTNGNKWTIYEKPDYSSEDLLIDAFIDGLSKKILDR